MRAAVVVAHPDDETLWFGGLVISQPYDWTIICCSIPRRDPIRAWKFFDACEVLGARPKLLPFAESEPDQLLPQLDMLDLSSYELIFTHNAQGEYGHVHHRQVHEHIKGSGKNMAVTCYGRAPGELVIDLSPEQIARKHNALRCYDHILPYEGQNLTKAEALLKRYSTYDFAKESYAFG